MHDGGWWSYIRYDEKQDRARITRGLLRRVAGYGRPYARGIASMLAIIVVITLLSLVPPLLVRELIDHVLPERNYSRLNLLAAGMVAIPLVSGLLGLGQRYLSATIGEGVIYDLRVALFARLQRNEPNAYGKDRDEMLAAFSRILTDLAERVPPEIELMFHFCYGDSNHKHVVEPRDMGDMVDMANRLTADIKRPIALVHMPVPRDRSDDAYFAPLARLRLRSETQLCLGLVHYTDGIEGTRRRLATAERHARDFSIATECGFGRRDPKTIPQLLRIHAQAVGA
jgi:hypothetical protein